MLSAPSLLEKKEMTEAVEIDRAIGKILAIAISGIFFAAISGFVLLRLVEKNTSGFYVLFLVLVGFFMTTVLLQVFLIKSWQIQTGMILVEFIALISPFISKILEESSLLVYVLVAIVLAYLFWSNFSGVAEYKNSLKIRFFFTARVVFGKIATAITLLIVIAYFFLFNLSTFEISESTMDRILRPATNFIDISLPGFHPKAKINDILSNLAKKKINELYGDTVVNKGALIDKAVVDFRAQLSEFLDMQVTGNETFNQLSSSVFNRFAKFAAKSNNKAVFGGTVVLLFFIVRSSASVINLFIMIFAYLVYQFLALVNFIIMSGDLKTKEIVVLSYRE